MIGQPSHGGCRKGASLLTTGVESPREHMGRASRKWPKQALDEAAKASNEVFAR